MSYRQMIQLSKLLIDYKVAFGIIGPIVQSRGIFNVK